MCRWFIAIFLFVLVAGSALLVPVAVGTDVAHDRPSVVTALEGDTPEPASNPARLGAAPDHGLSDTPSDLPEVILAVDPAPAPGPVAGGPLPPASHKRLQPTLDGLQRPPSARLVA